MNVSLKNFYALIIYFLPAVFTSQQCLSQSHPDSTSYLKSYLTNTRDIVVAPFHWDINDVANVTMVAGVTGFLMIYDEKMDDFVARNQNEKLVNFSKYVIAPFGSGVYSLPLLGAVYLSGIIGGNEYDKEMALLGLKTLILSAGEATVTKWMFQRHRPEDDVPPDSWIFEGPSGDLHDDGSFVSRHATTAFALAAVLAEGYKSKKKWVPYVAYTLASLVTVSRVYERKHWASDAFAGACLGYVTGKFLFKINAGQKQKSVNLHL
jgi:membrane-associated phospholipid phosphatase